MNLDSQSKNCTHVGLAHSSVGAVSVCPACGVVHVALKYLSLRLELDAFRELAHMLACAQIGLEQMDPVVNDAALPENDNLNVCNLH